MRYLHVAPSRKPSTGSSLEGKLGPTGSGAASSTSSSILHLGRRGGRRWSWSLLVVALLALITCVVAPRHASAADGTVHVLPVFDADKGGADGVMTSKFHASMAKQNVGGWTIVPHDTVDGSTACEAGPCLVVMVAKAAATYTITVTSSEGQKLQTRTVTIEKEATQADIADALSLKTHFVLSKAAATLAANETKQPEENAAGNAGPALPSPPLAAVVPPVPSPSPSPAVSLGGTGGGGESSSAPAPAPPEAGSPPPPPIEETTMSTQTMARATIAAALVAFATLTALEGTANEIAAAEQAEAAAAATTTEGPPSTIAAPAPSSGYDDYEVVAFGWDIVPFVGTSSLHTKKKVVRLLSLNLIGGYTNGVDGVEAAAVFNFDTDFMHGFQGAGVANIVLGDVEGFQGAGAVNFVLGSAEGFQGAGGTNFVLGAMSGAQMGPSNIVMGGLDGFQGGAVNVAMQGMEGFQGGAVNVAQGVVDGFQGGAVNVAVSEMDGFQGGAVNVVAGSFGGFQGGAVNVVAQEFDGFQAGAINVAPGKGNGVQLGVINVGEYGDLSLGLINIIVNGRSGLTSWVSSNGSVHAGFKHGGKYLHNIYSVGAYATGDETWWSLGFGLGGHIPLTSFLALDIDLLAHALFKGTWDELPLNQNTLRAVVVWSPFDNFSVFAGPAFDLKIDYDGAFVLQTGPAGVEAFTYEDGNVAIEAVVGGHIGVELF